MKWLKNLLVPNRYDCFLVVLALILFFAIVWANFLALPTSQSGIGLPLPPLRAIVAPYFLLLFAGIQVAIGASLTVSHYSKKRILVLLLATIGSPIVWFLAYHCLLRFPQLQMIRFNTALYGAGGEPVEEVRFWHSALTSLALLATLVASWLVFFLLTVVRAKSKTCFRDG